MALYLWCLGGSPLWWGSGAEGIAVFDVFEDNNDFFDPDDEWNFINDLVK